MNMRLRMDGPRGLRVTSDLMTWTPRYLVVAATQGGGYRYPSLFGEDTPLMGYAGWLYAGGTPAGGFIGVDTILVRRAITIVPA